MTSPTRLNGLKSRLKTSAINVARAIPTAKELLDHRAVFVYQDRKVLRKKYKDDRKAYKNAKDQLRYETGERYFKALETVIRQHAAVNGDAPVFERIWHFWCNHFAISEKDMLAQWNTGAYQREIIRPNICGNFTDLVKKVTTSWTMIIIWIIPNLSAPIRNGVKTIASAAGLLRSMKITPANCWNYTRFHLPLGIRKKM